MMRRNESRSWKPIQALLETVSRRLGIEMGLIAVTSANQRGPSVRAGFESGMLDSVYLTVSSHQVLFATLHTTLRMVLL